MNPNYRESHRLIRRGARHSEEMRLATSWHSLLCNVGPGEQRQISTKPNSTKRRKSEISPQPSANLILMLLALRLLITQLHAPVAAVHAASLQTIRDGKATYGVLAAGEKPPLSASASR